MPRVARTAPSPLPFAPTASFVALDFETADQGADSACAIGLVRVEQGQITARETRLIRPPRPFVRFAYIHGLTWPMLSRAPLFPDVWRELEPLVRNVEFIAAHNAGFDRGVLEACCARSRIASPEVPYVCTVRVARSVWQIRPTRLSDVCARLNIELNHHEAGSDAHACAQIILRAHAELAASRTS